MQCSPYQQCWPERCRCEPDITRRGDAARNLPTFTEIYRNFGARSAAFGEHRAVRRFSGREEILQKGEGERVSKRAPRDVQMRAHHLLHCVVDRVHVPDNAVLIAECEHARLRENATRVGGLAQISRG